MVPSAPNILHVVSVVKCSKSGIFVSSDLCSQISDYGLTRTFWRDAESVARVYKKRAALRTPGSFENVQDLRSLV